MWWKALCCCSPDVPHSSRHQGRHDRADCDCHTLIHQRCDQLDTGKGHRHTAVSQTKEHQHRLTLADLFFCALWFGLSSQAFALPPQVQLHCWLGEHPLLPATMQAVIVNKTGGPEVMELVHDYPIPQRKQGEVLVRVHSSSVNPIDTAVRAGTFPPDKFPKILGGDLAGVVAEADAGSKFKQGDRVAALTPGFWCDPQAGTYCQYVAVQESHLAALPPNIPLDTAGGLTLVGLTAWQALMAAAPHLGQRVLITAASGGVGHVAVQIARALGLHVVAVAGPQNAAWVQQALGADEVVDYSQQDFSKVYAQQQFDIVVDCRPNDPIHHTAVVAVLKPQGHYSHIANHGTDEAALQQMQAAHARGCGPGASLTSVEPNGAQLEELFELMANGKLKLEVALVLPLGQAAEGHRQVETGHTRGKVVLQIL